MSKKTAEAHITRVYRKLGIHSRAELGAWMAGNPWSQSTAIPDHLGLFSRYG